MINFGAFYAMVALGILLAREFLNWVWWYNWEDDEDVQNPAPILCATWKLWCQLRDACLWLRSRLCWLPECWLKSIWRRYFPPEPFGDPTDQDGWTPTEWLFIEIVGVWGLENWYKDDYDWEVKRKWGEFLKSRDPSESPEADEQVSAQTVD